MKRITFRTITLFAIILVALHACIKASNEPDAKPPTIEGNWVNLTKVHPDWRYHFDRNILTQYIIDFGDTIVRQQYTYAVRGDTVIIGGNPNNYEREWKVTFWCDSVAEAQTINTNVFIAPRLYLRKIGDF